MAQEKRLTGTVKRFSEQKGFRFISPNVGGNSLIDHQNSLRSKGFRMLTEGDVVESIDHEKSGRDKAVDVAGSAELDFSVLSRSRRSVFLGWRSKGELFGLQRRWVNKCGVGAFGSGRGGYRGGGACYKCGQDGHFQRDCPQSSQGGGLPGDGGRGGYGGGCACYKCGQDGHFRRDCPQSSQGGGLPGDCGSDGYGGGCACYKCGQDWHFQRDCPQSSQGGGLPGDGGRGGYGGGVACYKCGQDGHFQRDCPQSPQVERARGEEFGGMCFNCGKPGHVARDCSQSSVAGNSRFSGLCYNCGQSGHLARDCSQERESLESVRIGGYSGGGRGCYNCGEHGHLARDCPNNVDEQN